MKMTVTINEAELKEIIKGHLESQKLKVINIDVKITRGFDDRFTCLARYSKY